MFLIDISSSDNFLNFGFDGEVSSKRSGGFGDYMHEWV